MKTVGFLYRCIVGASVVALGAVSAAQAGSLVVSVDTGEANGTLQAAVYDSQASYDAEKLVAGAASPADGGSAIVTLDGLEPGTYGVAVFLDMNGNDELDTNLFGAPTEPYGFSMNPQVGFAAPKFDEFRFEHDGTDQQLTIQLHGN